MDRPYVIGLTGSIGMGKTETLGLFAAQDIPVYDADAAVHRLYARDGAAVKPGGKTFPAAVKDGAIDRAALSRLIEQDPEALKTLERLVHPLIAAERERFIDAAARAGARIVVLDIPLLFETGTDTQVDAIVVASAPSHIQHERVLARRGMTPEKFAFLHARQVPDAEKRAKAHFVVVTDKGLDHAAGQVRLILDEIRARLEKDAKDA